MFKKTVIASFFLTCCLFSRQQLVQAAIFPDVPTDSPYYSTMIKLQEKGVVKGNEDGTLGGEKSLNRAELVVIIVRAGNISPLVSDKNCFSDVQEQWFASAVCAAHRLEIISGYPDGKFRPEREVTAGEAAKIQVNALVPTQHFTDLEAALRFMSSGGLILNTFNTNAPINRYEAFERLSRVLDARSNPAFLEQVDSQGNPFDPEIDPIKNHLRADESVYTEWNQHVYDTFLGKGPMILFFYAGWCPYCRKSDEVLLNALPQLEGGVIWLKVNYDTENELKKEYGVTLQDTFVVLNAQGNVVAKYNALDDASEAQQWNDKALGQ